MPDKTCLIRKEVIPGRKNIHRDLKLTIREQAASRTAPRSND